MHALKLKIASMAAILLASGAVASGQETEPVGTGYANSIAPYRGPIGALLPNWGADHPGVFDPSLGYYGTAGFWGWGPEGGFYFWDGFGPHRPPLHALHGNWWWQTGLHPFDLYRLVVEQRGGFIRREEAMTQVTVGDDSLLLVVNVPADARVYINDRLTSSTGTRRQFASRGLKPNTPYQYTVRAEIIRDGKTLTDTQVVQLGSGKQAQVAFAFENVTRVASQSN